MTDKKIPAKCSECGAEESETNQLILIAITGDGEQLYEKPMFVCGDCKFKLTRESP